jgi:YbbR domain-containing protein
MFKRLAFVALSSALVAGQAHAGDTVTVNMPGGATQTVSSSTIAAAINTASSAGVVVSGGGESSSIASITQDVSTGAITVTTTGGQTYNVSSAFVGSLLGYYK